jgi:rubrerythrin
MAKHNFKEILELCLSLERKAVGFYKQLAKSSDQKELKKFWRGMAQQESEHVQFWDKLIELEDQGSLPNVFDNPGPVARELKKLLRQIDILCKTDIPGDPVRAVLMAYKLEFMMMHPAFPAMFYMMDKKTGNLSPERDYREHIGGLIRQIRLMGLEKPELELVADLMNSQWTVQQDLARRLAEIQELRALVPICSYCKNIRNDKGYWEKVETYVEARYPTEFSHGICPDCIRKYFPELYEDETKKISRYRDIEI